MTKTYIVYKHTSPSNKVYIGVTTKSLEERSGKNSIHYKSHKHFWNAIQKYGWDNFKHEILEEGLTKVEASIMEQYYVAKFKANDKEFGYNLTSGGELHFEMTDEIKKLIAEKTKKQWQNETIRTKMILALQQSHKGVYTELQKAAANKRKGVPFSEEHKQKLKGRVPWNKGKKNCFSADTLKKMSASLKGRAAWNKGKKLTEEHKQNVSIATKAAMDNPEVKQKIIASNEKRTGKTFKYFIYQYSLDDSLVDIHQGEANASRKTGICKAAIHNCVSGKTKTAGGYKWKKVSKEEHYNNEKII